MIIVYFRNTNSWIVLSEIRRKLQNAVIAFVCVYSRNEL